MVIYRAALSLLVTLSVGCDTFRSIDSVAEPDATSILDVAQPLPDSGIDLSPPPDVFPPDLPPDPPDTRGDAADLVDDAAIDTGPDLSGPRQCPDARAPVPTWASASSPQIRRVLIDGSDLVEINVSLAASAPGEVPQFVSAHRVTEGPDLISRATSIEPDGAMESVVVGHAVAEPFLDFTVARAPGAGEFAFLAATTTPGCSGTGIQAVHGRLRGVGAQFAQVDLDSLDADCDTFRAGVALTGADGTSPNFRILSTTQPNGESWAFPWSDNSSFMSTPGSQFTDHVSATSRDLVVTSAPGLDVWSLWQPATGNAPAELATGGHLDVAYLFEDCYVGASPDMTALTVYPIECIGDCQPGVTQIYAAGANVRRTAVAAMPGGGFVVAVATGDANVQIDAWFFDDAFQPIFVDGLASHPIETLGGTLGDIAIATTTEANDVLIGVVHSKLAFDANEVAINIMRLTAAF